MSVDLIERAEALLTLDKRKTYERMNGRNPQYGKGVRDAMKDIESLPAVDAVPVVRCGECGKYKMLSNDQTQVLCRGVWHEKNWYCADGEQKEEPHEDQT